MAAKQNAVTFEFQTSHKIHNVQTMLNFTIIRYTWIHGLPPYSNDSVHHRPAAGRELIVVCLCAISSKGVHDVLPTAAGGRGTCSIIHGIVLEVCVCVCMCLCVCMHVCGYMYMCMCVCVVWVYVHV